MDLPTTNNVVCRDGASFMRFYLESFRFLFHLSSVFCGHFFICLSLTFFSFCSLDIHIRMILVSAAYAFIPCPVCACVTALLRWIALVLALGLEETKLMTETTNTPV